MLKSIASKFLRRLGLRVARVTDTPYEHLLALPRYEETAVTLLDRPFRIADAASFYWSHREIFVDEIYRFTAPSAAPVIVDCGANHGTSVVYFKSLYPRAKITAVESDPKIFAHLAWNIAQRAFSGVTLVNKAISNETAPVRFFHEGADAGRAHFLEGAKGTFEVEPIALDTLLDGQIDFLKMDIEGAETEAICASKKLGNVGQMFIEYHSFAGAEQTLARLLQKLTASGFRYYIQTQFCAPRPLLAAECQLGMDLQLNIFAKREGCPESLPAPA
jgi:FkbM family methyltransferase